MPNTEYNFRNMPLTTWLTCGQVERLRAIAKAHGVSAAAFLRAIVIDVLADEAEGFSLYLSPSGENHYHAHLKLKSKTPDQSCVSKTS